MKLPLTLGLALRNLGRHRGRTLSTVVAMTVGLTGLAFLDGYVNYSLWGLGETVVHSGTGHLQIAAPAYFDDGDTDPFPFLLPDDRALARELRRLPEVKDVVPSLTFTGVVVRGGSMETVRVQAYPTAQRLDNFGFLTLRQGRDFGADESGGVLVGAGLAHKLGLEPGDSLSLNAVASGGGLSAQDYTVVGVVSSGIAAADAVSVFVDLADAQGLLGTDRVPLVTVFLEQTADTDAVLARMADHPPAHAPPGAVFRGWKDLSAYYRQAESSYLMVRAVAGFIVLVVALFSISATLNLSVLERLRELGTLRALGTRRGRVVGLLMAEGLLLGVAGALAGALVGATLTAGVNALGGLTLPPQPGMSAPLTILFRPDGARFLTNGLWVVAAALVGSAFPAFVATRRLTAELLRCE